MSDRLAELAKRNVRLLHVHISATIAYLDIECFGNNERISIPYRNSIVVCALATTVSVVYL